MLQIGILDYVFVNCLLLIIGIDLFFRKREMG